MTRARPELPMIVMLDQRLPDGAERELVGCLASLGTPRVCRQPDLRAAGELSLLMLIYVPLAAFLAGFGTELGRDSYRRLVAALRRLLDRRPPAGPAPPAVAGFYDTGTAVLIVLEPGLPDSAYRLLGQLDLAGLRPGPVRFRDGRWRSVGP